MVFLLRLCQLNRVAGKFMKKWILVFIFAFVLNLIWEWGHSFLYANYKGGAITEFILARAALTDAVIILGLIFVLRLSSILVRHSWLLILVGIIISILIEYWALSTGRWEYKDIMPIIPLLNTGLTPTIQLGLLSYIVYRISFKKITELIQ